MTDTPQEQQQQPTPTLSEEERRTLRSAAVRAGALVAQAEPGFLDTFKESFAASRAVKAASPQVQQLLVGGLPEMPSGNRDEAEQRTLELLEEAVAILQRSAPHLVDEYRSVVLQSARDVAAAADDTAPSESAAISRIEQALAG